MRVRVVLLVIILAFISSNCFADDSWMNAKYGLSYINNFSSCDTSCQENSLSYADDQINQLDNQLDNAGLTKQFKYANTQVQSTDIIEDYYNGYDRFYADNVELYAITTHGNVYTNSNSGVHFYYASYCSSGNANYNSGIGSANCFINSNKIVLGEQINSFDNTYSTYTGKLRWLILSTCHSVDATPMNYWGTPFLFGIDYLMGYKGTMMLGETTDECLADFAEHAFGGSSKFKSVWFSANDDWYEDNTAGVFTCGNPSINTLSGAENYRDNYVKTYSPRQITTCGVYYCVWSWHQG